MNLLTGPLQLNVSAHVPRLMCQMRNQGKRHSLHRLTRGTLSADQRLYLILDTHLSVCIDFSQHSMFI